MEKEKGPEGMHFDPLENVLVLGVALHGFYLGWLLQQRKKIGQRLR